MSIVQHQELTVHMSQIWMDLMQGRSVSVLHLHNAMSAIPMQAKMATRPTKTNIKETWAATSESTKQKAKVLLETVLKYVGKGDIDVPISAMSTVGMPAFMSTGWDWRRMTVRKNKDRAIDPSIQAIIMELEFAHTYRPELLRDPIIWELRETLRAHILHYQTTSSLNPATAGSHAQRKDWQWWDGISIPKPSAEDITNGDTHLSAEEILRRRGVVTAHRNALLHLVKIITDMPIAHVTPHKDSGIAMHVAYYTNKLVKVSPHIYAQRVSRPDAPRRIESIICRRRATSAETRCAKTHVINSTLTTRIEMRVSMRMIFNSS